MSVKSIFTYLFTIAFLVIPISTIAQTAEPDFVPNSAEAVDDGKGAGWHPWLKFAGNMALGQSQNVPGATDGISVQLGYILGARLDFFSQKKTNEWANILGMELGYTRTPVVDSFIKSIDKISFESTYLYHPTALPWLGPFVTLRLTTPMLPGYEVRSDPTSVVRLGVGEELALDDDGNPVDGDGTPLEVTEVRSGKKIDLTDAFAPLTLRESVGVFAVPLDKPWMKTDFRLGFGAWETFVRDGYTVADDEDTENYFELQQMQDSVLAGPELALRFSGAVKENLSYYAGALFMYPLVYYEDTDTGISGIEKMTMEFEAGLSLKIIKYVSIDYSFKGYRQPAIVDKWQIQNNILLSIAFEVPSPAPAPPACPACPECPTAEQAPASADDADNAAPADSEDAAATPDNPSDPTADAPPSESASEPAAPTDTPADAATPQSDDATAPAAAPAAESATAPSP